MSFKIVYIFFFLIWFSIFNMISSTKIENTKTLDRSIIKQTDSIFNWHIVKITRDVKVKEYFYYLDSLVQKYDSIVSYKLNEHLLAHTNPWIIDSLANTDYYRMMKKDSFVYNQKELIVLHRGQTLKIPNSITAKTIHQFLENIWIDVNIPEFKLRILKDSIVLHSFPIRVGKYEKKYLKMADRITNLKTRTGKGQIIAHVKNPDFYNPVNGQQYYATTRDDKRVTLMPQIPWIETELNGVRYGQLIHPTTNPKTLGKAYSNGCIGTKEADAWFVYYHAPIGTPIIIRYELNVLNNQNELIRLKDIYKKN